MTAEAWLNCTDPGALLDVLRGKAGERELRLFAVACCRRIWGLVSTDHHQLALLTERYADGLATREDLLAALAEAHDPDWTAGLAFEEAAGVDEAPAAADDPVDRAGFAAGNAAHAAADAATDYPNHGETNPAWATAHAAETRAQAAILRDLFPWPLGPVRIDARWRTPTVQHLAAAIYDEGAFDRLPILADALEEARCHDADVLAHCRRPGQHVRGCWLVDLLLGKE